MARLDLDRNTLEAFVGRINRIESADQRQWGTMEPEKLVAHLEYMFRVSLGEVDVKTMFFPAPKFILWVLFFEWFTNWPGGKFKAPENFFPSPAENLDQIKSECIEAAGRFVAQLESDPEQIGLSPLLGQITLRKWARVHGVHMDHHLRQYGV
jgi:hypothetical protein